MSPEVQEFIRTIVYIAVGFGGGYIYSIIKKRRQSKKKGEFSLLYSKRKDKTLEKL